MLAIDNAKGKKTLQEESFNLDKKIGIPLFWYRI